MNLDWITVTKDPVWPWSLSPVGLPALVIVAAVLTVLTVWAYRGVRGVSAGRVLAVLALRLTALVLACLMVLRPSFVYHDDPHQPSTLLFALDGSESMSTKDEFDGQSRYEQMRRLLSEGSAVALKKLEKENVHVLFNRFAEDVRAFSDADKPDGKRTDFGQMLHALYESHSRDRNLRGLIVLSDGADNGNRYPPLTEASRWRALNCPVYTFALGKTTTSEGQKDLAFTAIHPSPTPVAVKGKLTVRGTLDAPGFQDAAVTVHLLLDGKEVLAQKERLNRTLGNEIRLTTDAPETPGEVKVTLKVDPLPNELSIANNQIDTYVTVTKEGISVLMVDRPRFPEPQRICDALASDPRIRLYTAWRRSDAPGGSAEDSLELDKRHYDVIIIGDVSARRLTGGDPHILEQIREAVSRGTGLIMMGGSESFGNSDWQGTPVEEVLPVKIDSTGQIEDEVQMEPTAAGLTHYVMRLTEGKQNNEALWAKLPKLTGINRLDAKASAAVLAVRAGNKQQPVLVGGRFGEGRTLAFAGDTTWRWELLGQPKSAEGVLAHQRFWKQVVLWLAKQDDVEGSVWVKPDTRRLATGAKLDFAMGIRGKGGIDLKDGEFKASIIGPHGTVGEIPPAREQTNWRGTFWKTDTPGEYRVVVSGTAKDVDGKEVQGQAQARFVIYEDDAELVRRAADHDFLDNLAKAGGGSFHMASELPAFLAKLPSQPLPQGQQKAETWPDWRRNTVSEFLFAFLLLFVAVLSLEWFLRRAWGLV